jgi:hypothetical protein
MVKTGRIASGGRQQTSKALTGAALIHLVPGILYWSIHGVNFEIVDWIYAGGFAVFMLMAIWAHWSPLLPALVCAALYIPFLLLKVRDIAAWRPTARIIHGSILILIAIAIAAALKRPAEGAPPSESGSHGPS